MRGGSVLGAVLLATAGCGGLLGLRSDYYLDDNATEPDASESGVDARDDDGGSDANETGIDAEVSPPSCVGLAPTCGPVGATESCCASALVPGGTFDDEILHDDGSFLATAPATVSTFRLDKYVVTVGRFRSFVTASLGGYVPPQGSGKHAHLPAGGVTQPIGDAGASQPELGWDSSWILPGSASEWNTYLHDADCESDVSTYSDTPNAARDSRAVNCVPWEGAYAFCIWDGGFLPTEAEYAYAGVGGSEQRYYPWSMPPADETIDWLHASYGDGVYHADWDGDGCYGDPASLGILHRCSIGDQTVPGSKPAGNARWGHSDIVGLGLLYTLDCDGALLASCTDCARLFPACPKNHVVRGSQTAYNPAQSRPGMRDKQYFTNPRNTIRCARTP